MVRHQLIESTPRLGDRRQLRIANGVAVFRVSRKGGPHVAQTAGAFLADFYVGVPGSRLPVLIPGQLLVGEVGWPVRHRGPPSTAPPRAAGIRLRLKY